MTWRHEQELAIFFDVRKQTANQVETFTKILVR